MKVSPDGRRVVVTVPFPGSDLPTDPAIRSALDIADSAAGRPHAVIARRADGVRRVWRVRSREESRRIARTYREHGGSAVFGKDL